ncbi:hypothetical protein JCM10450v2_001373 [Rhodotorula kratochvilovae]
MAESNAFLAYGVTVTTESLLHAVGAWPNLQGAFAFLDPVQLRRDNGTRAVQMPECRSSALERLPSEVWSVVRHKVVDIELKRAQVELVRSLICDECADAHNLGFADIVWGDTMKICDMLHFGCDWCEYEGLNDPTRLRVARTLLASYGLALPTHIPIRAAHGAAQSPVYLWADWTTAIMLTLLPHLGTGENTFALGAGCDRQHPDEQAIVDVSFFVPRDATSRFHRLVSQLHLQLVDVSDGILANAGSSETKSKEDSLRLENRRCKEIPLHALTPRWKFLTAASMW